ncbi:TetR/AcrR family transcriptional regulator [Dongia rigui]|uniref:TetR/AcrR family transcriptional regulator n=1 Tax=Dongia rigui TaxID=940149 RepID=A0ABU5DXK3_9PROT|nr:TetR/AcrR family transcriptional regulator [Dongia rigui]MDY0871669.1 TetR/AcrR family transcriptional regulator [Dongia rigui]
MSDAMTTAGRRQPTQARAKERVELILSIAQARIAASGSDALRMSDIAAEAGISIGSLYQYFPDKAAIIGTLAERYNAEGQACVAAIFAGVTEPAHLEAALVATLDGYYRMFCAEPVMRDIWSATLADKALQEIDAADCRAHGEQLADLLHRLKSAKRQRDERDRAAFLTMQLIAAIVRAAIAQPRQEGDALIETAKRLRPWAGLVDQIVAQ